MKWKVFIGSRSSGSGESGTKVGEIVENGRGWFSRWAWPTDQWDQIGIEGPTKRS